MLIQKYEYKHSGHGKINSSNNIKYNYNCLKCDTRYRSIAFLLEFDDEYRNVAKLILLSIEVIL